MIKKFFFYKNRTFIEHLKILRLLLLTSLFFFVIFFFLFYFFWNFINNILYSYFNSLIIDDNHLKIYTLNIFDSFLFKYKICFYLSLISVFYLFVFLLIFFMKSFFFNCFFLFFSFSLPFFSFFFFKNLIPFFFKNFLENMPDYLCYIYNINDIISFTFQIFFCSLLVVYTPIILLFLIYFFPKLLKFFKKFRKYFYFLVIVILGILTPADFLSHFLTSTILIIFCEIIYFFVCSLRK